MEESVEQNIAPTIMVIFGITGDLSRRKLIPALLDLEAAGILPSRMRIIGFSRREFSRDAFLAYVREVIAERSPAHKEECVERFLKKVGYCQALFDDAHAYRRLGEQIMMIETKTFKQCANKLYYLAVPPSLYELIFRQLALSGLTIPCGGGLGWARVLVEKPFGHNAKMAKELDQLLGLLFKEEQVFRIDHYLAKEVVQNILTFRFSNALFEPLWTYRHIAKVEVSLYERGGIEGRGAFYDGIGALRDVGQNHILQMLALVAMEQPKEYTANAIRRERARVLSALHTVPLRGTDYYAVRGQYEGYTNEKDVAPDSQTETAFEVKAFVRNKRWRGVPFYLRSVKAHSESKTEIRIYFHPSAHCLCLLEKDLCPHENALVFRVQPEEGIMVCFWAKKPGPGLMLEERDLSFSYRATDADARLPDAYERLLSDALLGDQTLFASTEEVRAAWRFTMSILRAWRGAPLVTYKKETDGPRVRE